ncbi:MAG TPA: hypothetical protein VGM49_02175, partial [Candidatus Limnocylindrales bacterium]
NFVVFKVQRDRAAFIDAMRRRGVLVTAYPHGQVRAVTHYGVERSDIEAAIRAFREALVDTAPSDSAGSLAGTAA